MRNQIIVLLVAAGPRLASANAFVVNEHDAKATGRADATVASDTGPSSIVYNPGGIAVDDGTNVSIGGTLVLAHGDFTDLGGTKTNTANSPAELPQMFVTSRVHELVSVGLGFHTPFGLALKWPTTTPLSTVVFEESLRTFFITPVVGVNLHRYVPGLSVGTGLDIVPATVELRRNISFGTAQGDAHLGGNATGFGGRIGAMYRPEPLPELSVGAMWRSEVREKFSGTGDFNVDDPTFRPQLPEDGPISTTVTLPQSVTLGASYRVIPDLELEADAMWMGWSSIKSLDIHATAAGNMPVVLSSPRNYDNTWTIRVGAEYALPQWHAAVRAGYMYDPTPIPTTVLGPDLPDANRHVVSVGGSMQFGDYGVHLGLMGLLPVSRDTAPATGDTQFTPEFHGTYRIEAFVASVSVTGKFGGTRPDATTSAR
jgi:long-chain fatty acid transport protein